jgi:transcriptional regulator with XRE-family HTH domain
MKVEKESILKTKKLFIIRPNEKFLLEIIRSGIGIKQIALKTGISRTKISLWKTGHKRPSTSKRQVLSTEINMNKSDWCKSHKEILTISEAIKIYRARHTLSNDEIAGRLKKNRRMVMYMLKEKDVYKASSRLIINTWLLLDSMNRDDIPKKYKD